jgi:hypothetical protein
MPENKPSQEGVLERESRHVNCEDDPHFDPMDKLPGDNIPGADQTPAPIVTCDSQKATPIINDSSHGRRLAADAYRLANQLEDPLAKNAMLDIARSYEQLAVLAEAPFEIAGRSVEKARQN